MMNRDTSYRNEDTDPLNVNGISFEFSVDEEDAGLSSGSKILIRTVVANANTASLRHSRTRSPPPQTLTRENSSSTKNSQSTRGSTDSEGSLRNGPAVQIAGQGRKLHKSTTSGKRPSMSTPPTISSSVSGVAATERSGTSFINKGSLGSAESYCMPLSSGASVTTSKTNITSKSATTEKTNASDDTEASDDDRAQRRIEREQLAEKKRLHEERRNACAAQTRRPQLIKSPAEQVSSDRSMDINELHEHRPAGAMNGSNESLNSVDNVSKSILKQGRFSYSDVSSGSKKPNGHASKISNSASCGKVRFHARDRLFPQKMAGVSLSEPGTIFHDGKQLRTSFSSSPQHNCNQVRHIPEDGYGRPQSQRGHDSICFEGEGALRIQRGLPAELPEMRRRNPPKFDPRAGRSPSRGSLPGRPGKDPSHSMEARQNGLPVPLTSIRRQLTPQEHQHLLRRKQELQRQHQQQLQLQTPQPPLLQQEKAQRKGLFGRKTVSPPIEPPQLTHNQIRMAAAQAAFAMVGEN